MIERQNQRPLNFQGLHPRSVTGEVVSRFFFFHLGPLKHMDFLSFFFFFRTCHQAHGEMCVLVSRVQAGQGRLQEST